MSTALSGVNSNVLIGAVDADTNGWSADVSVNTFDSTTTADGGWDDETAATKRIEGSFESVRGIAMQFQSARRISNREWSEQRGFNQDILRGSRDLGFGTTHHSSQGDRMIGVSDDTHVRRQHIFLVIDRLQLLA